MFPFSRLFIKKCLGCSERVSPEELVMRASDNIFHLRCFVCVVCGIRLQKGDLYVIKQGQLFCRTDYEKEVEMMQGFGYGKYLSFPNETFIRYFNTTNIQIFFFFISFRSYILFAKSLFQHSPLTYLVFVLWNLIIFLF